LVKEARELNASFIIFDPMIRAFHLDKLVPLYNAISSRDVGKAIPILPENATFSEITNGHIIDTITPVFVKDTYQSKVVVFQLTNGTTSMSWGEDFSDLIEWNVFLGGNMTSSDGLLQLSREPSNDKVYIEYQFSGGDVIEDESAIAINIANQDNNTISGFYLLFRSGEYLYQTFDTPGVYVFSLNSYVNLIPRTILLYNLWGGQNSTVDLENVYYDWVSIIEMDG
jgi:hypothetical protein